MCTLQRPLDDKSHTRNRLEADAVLAIIQLCESGRAILLSSVALEFENSRNTQPIRRDYVHKVLAQAKEHIPLTTTSQQLAASFVQAGLKTLDALHLACAAIGTADYFCTCDDRFLKRGRSLMTTNPKVVSPLELYTELGL